VPGFPELDYRNLPPLVAQNLFFDALHEGRQAILRTEEGRKARDEEEAEYAHRLEQDSEKAQGAHRRAVEAEYARLLEENLRKAEAARRREENEAFARLLREDKHKAEKAHRQAMEQEERRRQAEREFVERERREQERREKERRELEAAQSNLITRLFAYEKKWAELRSKDAKDAKVLETLSFYDIPWPSFEDVLSVGDITQERVLAFVCHEREDILAKSLRLEILRWHPDKFDTKVLGMVVKCHREAVREAARQVACILITFSDTLH
jgi:hypothetical protein